MPSRMGKSNDFQFDPVTHTYKLNGVILPSVTQVLKEAGLYDYGCIPQESLEKAARFGSAVHKACQLDDIGRLGDFDPAGMEYVEGWRAFRKEYPIKFTMNETKLYSERWMFAGTLDRYSENDKTIIDIKTGVKDPWHHIQTSGYETLLMAWGLKVNKRLIVYLSPSKFEVVESKSPTDQAIFLSTVQLYWWKRNNKKGNKYDTDSGI